VDKEGYIKVIDFGLSKKIMPDKVCEELSGTFMYMAPEMINKQGHNMSVDWWALGIILYELKFSMTPFAALSRNDHRRKITFEKLVFPKQKNINCIDLKLLDLIQQLL